MTIPNSFELAHDSEFRLLANFTTPPRAGRITVLEPSGQVRVATDDPDGGDVLAWPLNGFTYAVDDVVYIAFAANSPDTAIVIGAKAPLPTLEPAVYSHDHDSAYVKQDGTTTLDADWDIGEDRRIKAEALRARDGEGLRLEDDAGILGIFLEDGGQVGVGGVTSPNAALHVQNQASRTEVKVQQFNATNDLSRLIFHDSADALMASFETGRGAFRHTFADGFVPSDNYFALYNTIAQPLYLGTNDRIWGTILSSGFVGFGTTSPQGKFHIHDGTGGLIFVTKTGIGNVAQTIIPNAAGDVTGAITGFFIVNDGSGAVANALTMLPGDTLDIAIGGYTMRLALNVNGALTAVRQSGAGTGTLVLLAVWM
jgi:hypothetical protein